MLDDYLFIKLNDELNLNNIDTSGKENLIATREPTGTTKKYNMKVLLNVFNSFTKTAIMNTITFKQPLQKLDRISLTLMDLGGNIINNANCEWNVSLHITESINYVASTQIYNTQSNR